MSKEERFQKYIKEYCHNCKNREKDLCDIKVFVLNNEVITKCVYYEKD